MDIQFYGANCITLTGKHGRVVIDDNLTALGAKSITKPGDIALFTSSVTHTPTTVETKLEIDHGGEYEVSDISIYGIPARSHLDEEGKQTATMYKIISKELSVFIPGHVYPELTDEQLESVGMVDIMLIPVGANGFTLDPVGALKIIKKIEPKIVIPTHYDGGPGGGTPLKFEVPQQTLEQAITSLSMEPKEPVQKLKLKAGELPEIMELVVLERS
ncbi:MAG TPA: MBL fold metallo-hydrolase [Candidatus Saccharimonadales bacterium]|jgi:L-ascorbate metabolism protein UlaG (beta-lactamase superfamily)